MSNGVAPAGIPLPVRKRELSNLAIGAGTKIVALFPLGHRVRQVIGGDEVWLPWRRGDRVTGFHRRLARSSKP